MSNVYEIISSQLYPCNILLNWIILLWYATTASWWVKHLKRLEQSINHSPTMFNLSPSDLKVFVRKESNLSPASDRLFLWSLGDWNFLRQPYKDTTAENMINSRTDLSEHPCAITPCIRAQFDYHYHERHYQPIIYMSGFVRRRVVQRFSTEGN